MEDKDSTFTLRLPLSLRQSFEEAAKRNDRTAAQLLRDFMRDYVAANAQAALPLKRRAK